MFEMEGTVTLSVSYPKGIKSAVIRPSRAGLTPMISGSDVTFEITEWGQYTVEFNGDPETDALIIFANPPMKEFPANARIINGRLNQDLSIGDNETVYLAPGAVVAGKVYMGNNSKLTGRGIITGSAPAAIEVHNKRNVTIEGVTILDPKRWVVELRDCDGVTLENVKIISARNNGDGITVQSSRNININKCFIRSWDDGIVLKNYTENNCRNINVTNCVLWTDLAQSLEIGFETNKGRTGREELSPNKDPRIHDIIFENIDIIHNFHKAPVSIHNADNCRIYNIKFKNITIDNAVMGEPGKYSEGGGWPYLLDFGNGHSGDMGGANGWTHNEGYREIKDVSVENIRITGGKLSSCGARFVNRDSGGKSVMENIQLKNICFQGELIDYNAIIDEASLTGKITQTDVKI